MKRKITEYLSVGIIKIVLQTEAPLEPDVICLIWMINGQRSPLWRRAMR